MGPINGKQSLSQSQTYFQTQVDLFKWRANSNFNSHIARVSFSSLNSIIHRQKFQSLLEEQKRKKSYIEFSQVLQLSCNRPISGVTDQIMVFQDYIGDLTLLIEKLTLEESLYALETLLRGYQTIFQKIGRTVVALECCFVTEEGEVRTWFNSNFMSNDLPLPSQKNNNNCQNRQLQLTQVGIIRQVLKISEYLPNNRSQYHHFARQLRQFMDKDILHNFNFASVRKFINGYIYNYRLTLSSNLLQAIKRNKKSRASSPYVSPNKMASSLAEYIQNGESASKGRMISTGGNMSTGANLQLVSRIQEQSGREGNSPSLTSYSSKTRFQYYTPQVTNKNFHEKKLSTTQASRVKQRQLQRHLSKSAMVLNKQMSNIQSRASIPNSFTKKSQKYYQEEKPAPSHNNTPNKENTLSRNHLSDSTAMLSQLTHSKEQSRFNNSKVYEESQSYPYQFNQPHTNPKLEKKNSNPYKYVSFSKEEQKGESLEQIKQGHPRIQEVSIESNSSAIFGNSPPPEFVDYPQINKYSCSMYPFQNAKPKQFQVMDGALNTPLSTKVERSPSLHVERHVSGLIFNSGLSLHESVGSLTSMQNSCYSDYNGLLTRMGHSAKLVHIPTNKYIPLLNKSVSNGAFLTF